MPVSISVPLPILVRLPVPEIVPENVVLGLSLAGGGRAGPGGAAPPPGGGADGLVEAVEVESGAARDRECAERRERVDGAGLQRAGIDRRRAGIRAASRQGQRARADLGQASRPADR